MALIGENCNNPIISAAAAADGQRAGKSAIKNIVAGWTFKILAYFVDFLF
jgi:hypothetical protein